MLTSCSAPAKTATAVSLYVFRLRPPALLQLSADHQVVREIPVGIPDGCAVGNVYAPPIGGTLALELSCSFGPAVVWLNTDTGEARQPVTNSDSHFMAWAPDGQSAYLKVDSVNRPHIVRAAIGGGIKDVPITELTYDLGPEPRTGADFLFSFSRGMGLGSEMWIARSGGNVVRQVLADAHNYLAFARWSPDGSQIAFIKIPDSATPFTVGGLWVMEADGSGARKLAETDAGHGFAEAWSPDGKRIAFVVRENPEDLQADQDAQALRSNLAVLDVQDGTETKVTSFENARVEAPAWAPDGNSVAFTVVLNDKMNVYLVDASAGHGLPVSAIPVCCPVWVQK